MTRLIAPAGRTLRLLLVTVAVLHALSLTVNVLHRGLESAPFVHFDWVYAFLDVDQEHNLPTWFASSLLLFSALVLAEIGITAGRVGDRFARHWKVLALVFVFLALDEATQIHEAANVLRDAFDLTGLLYLSWILVAMPLVVLFALAYLRFLGHLPKPVRLLVLVGGALYVGGAVGMEVVGSVLWDNGPGYDSMAYAFSTAVEELLEMLGSVSFLYGVASYLHRYPPSADGSPVQETVTRRTGGILAVGGRHAPGPGFPGQPRSVP
ncbi:hypothetical protein AB0J90_35020 [Micromonospora sp. NPDC049523]|uniref:hypothetical protein n=1 Tax=Micromonospora sp. NPDC049523 TaxID=3155921 RepID=UPI00343F8D19